MTSTPKRAKAETRRSIAPTSPSRPLPVRWWVRLSDRIDARRCGRATPPHPGAEDPVPSTSRVEHIRATTNGAVEAERIAYLRDTSDDRIRLAELKAAFDSECALHRAKEQQRAHAADNPPAPAARTGEAHLPPSSIARRRQRELEQHLAPLAAAIDQTRQRMDALSTEIAFLTMRIDDRLSLARARSRRLLQRQEARIWHYRSELCAVHPDGSALNAAFTRHPVLEPAWLNDDQAVHLTASVD